MQFIDSYTFGFSYFFIFVATFFILYRVVFSKVVFGFFDPYNITTNVTISASISLYLYLIFSDYDLTFFKYYYPLYCFEFLFCVYIIDKFVRKFYGRIKLPCMADSLPNINVLSMSILIILITIATQRGIVLFAEDPNVAKTEIYREGGGALRRIIQALLDLYAISLFYELFNGKLKKVKFLAHSSIYITVVALTSGAKGGLLAFFIYYMLSMYYYNRHIDKGKASFLLTLCIGYMFLVVYLGVSDIMIAALRIVTRIIGYADNIFYFLTYDNIVNLFDDRNCFNLLYHTFGTLLASVKLLDWSQVRTLGGEMFELLTGVYDGRGPNSSLILEAHVFFGPFYAIFYFAIVLTIISFMRCIAWSYFNDKKNNTFFAFFLFIIFTSMPVYLTVDTSFLGTLFIDLPLRLIPVIVFYIINRCKGKINATGAKSFCSDSYLELR